MKGYYVGAHGTDEYPHYFFKDKEKAEEYAKKNGGSTSWSHLEVQEIWWEDEKET